MSSSERQSRTPPRRVPRPTPFGRTERIRSSEDILQDSHVLDQLRPRTRSSGSYYPTLRTNQFDRSAPRSTARSPLRSPPRSPSSRGPNTHPSFGNESSDWNVPITASRTTANHSSPSKQATYADAGDQRLAEAAELRADDEATVLSIRDEPIHPAAHVDQSSVGQAQFVGHDFSPRAVPSQQPSPEATSYSALVESNYVEEDTATVLSIQDDPVHPNTDMDGTSAEVGRAELIGLHCSPRDVPAQEVAEVTSYAAVRHGDYIEEDAVPGVLLHATSDNTEEAQVLMEGSDSSLSLMDRKPAAVEDGGSIASDEAVAEAVADEEGQVTSIATHPAEYAEDGAQAELVATTSEYPYPRLARLSHPDVAEASTEPVSYGTSSAVGTRAIPADDFLEPVSYAASFASLSPATATYAGRGSLPVDASLQSASRTNTTYATLQSRGESTGYVTYDDYAAADAIAVQASGRVVDTESSVQADVYPTTTYASLPPRPAQSAGYSTYDDYYSADGIAVPTSIEEYGEESKEEIGGSADAASMMHNMRRTEDDDLVALKLAAYGGPQRSDVGRYESEEAAVLSISQEPLHLSAEASSAVQAELVVSDVQSPATRHEVLPATEDVAVSSAAIAFSTVEVVAERDDSKPAAVHLDGGYDDFEGTTSAEVVEVQEMLHPSEMESVQAHAEWVAPAEGQSVQPTTYESTSTREANGAVEEEAAVAAVVLLESTPTAPTLTEEDLSEMKLGPNVVPPPRSSSTGSRRRSDGARATSSGSRHENDGNRETSVSSRHSHDGTTTDLVAGANTVAADVGPVPPPQPFGAGGAEASALSSSATSDRSATSTSSHRGGLQTFSSHLSRGTVNVMEAIFGDNRHGSKRELSVDAAANSVAQRTLLPWSVIFSPPTSMWVATMQTNQKALEKNDVAEASKSLRAFSVPTEKQALCLARAWTPPRMLPFEENPECHICQSKLTLFRRKCHCRNCGVGVCKDCSLSWPARMLPETYNFKKDNTVNICKSCDWLCHQFRLALLEGDMDKAIALHSTGNVNLHTPFANVKGELLYPVHCAVLGGNLDLLKWLVDENCCPIKSVRVSGSAKDSRYTPIVTSKGRSLLGIAMENNNVSIVRYLVVMKGILLAGEKDITMDMLIVNLDRVLRMLPEEPSISPALFEDPESSPVDLESFETDTALAMEESNDRKDECIICFDSKIDCVATPCGHQICCLQCSSSISRCPVCSAKCKFLRVFKP